MSFIEYNPNPVGRNVGDCSVRAIAKALDMDWESAYSLLSANGLLMGDMPSADSVWGATLRQYGYSKHLCPDCYTVSYFANRFPKGTYVLALGGHVVTVKDGNFYDSWDSGNEMIQYYWSRKEISDDEF